MNWSAAKKRMLIAEAVSYIGVREVGGENSGEFVKLFQRAVGKAEGEPWCISFIQHCVKKIDSLTIEIFKHIQADGSFDLFNSKNPQCALFETEHALTLWKTAIERFQVAEPGLIAIWQHGDTASGHGGIVETVEDGFFTTIEGNTNDSGSREGDGVYRKTCSYGTRGKLKLLGFIDPWP